MAHKSIEIQTYKIGNVYLKEVDINKELLRQEVKNFSNLEEKIWKM